MAQYQYHATAASSYYNETTGKIECESRNRNEASLCVQSSSSVPLPKNWVEALFEASGA